MSGPTASPHPDYDGIPDHPSGSHNVATIREAVVIADQAVAKTEQATKLQWVGIGVLGSVVLGVGGFLGWCLITLGVIGNAQAQTAAKAEAALDKGRMLEQRIETIDAGTRMSIENLRREIAEDRASTDRKLAEILRAVKAK